MPVITREEPLPPAANFLKKVGQKLLIRPFGPVVFSSRAFTTKIRIAVAAADSNGAANNENRIHLRYVLPI